MLIGGCRGRDDFPECVDGRVGILTVCEAVSVTIEPPAPGEPRRPLGPRDPGDAWVVAPTGERYWGRFGAAGLLAVDPVRGVLLQHRVSWSHHGGTWALPGGARHEGESALDGALREATEEAGVPDGAVRPRLMSVLDLGYWSYATVLADVVDAFDPVISDPESVELSWVPVADVDDYPLHPGFAASWPRLRELLAVRPKIVVDAANVAGSVPDGWWNDRAGAAERLVERLRGLAVRGIPGDALGLAEDRWYPEIKVVLEGRAREAAPGAEVFYAASYRTPVVLEIRAEAAGDDAIVWTAREEVEWGAQVIVVTSDRELAARCEAIGASVRGTRWLLDLFED
ncbi:NUDIX domain-containing protein [Microbacterium binotii]|uniref:NUDIX domain-containing protein n=1 Tax=Microbacterium binotii TaxID=462710 RepID=A0ABN3PK50_9MICO